MDLHNLSFRDISCLNVDVASCFSVDTYKHHSTTNFPLAHKWYNTGNDIRTYVRVHIYVHVNLNSTMDQALCGATHRALSAHRWERCVRAWPAQRCEIAILFPIWIGRADTSQGLQGSASCLTTEHKKIYSIYWCTYLSKLRLLGSL